MMPPEQETGAVATPGRTITNCNDDSSVRVEPALSSCNVSPCNEDLFFDDQPLPSLKFSTLQRSSFAVTLKVTF